jgi:hypothetical protein
LLAQWNHAFLLVVKLEHRAAAAVLDDGFDVLEVDKVSTVGFEEATPGEAARQILQGEIGDCLFAGGAQVGFALTAGSVEDVAGIVEQDAVFFARGDFERREVFWRGGAGGSLEGIIVHKGGLHNPPKRCIRFLGVMACQCGPDEKSRIADRPYAKTPTYFSTKRSVSPRIGMVSNKCAKVVDRGG